MVVNPLEDAATLLMLKEFLVSETTIFCYEALLRKE